MTWAACLARNLSTYASHQGGFEVVLFQDDQYGTRQTVVQVMAESLHEWDLHEWDLHEWDRMMPFEADTV